MGNIGVNISTPIQTVYLWRGVLDDETNGISPVALKALDKVTSPTASACSFDDNVQAVTAVPARPTGNLSDNT